MTFKEACQAIIDTAEVKALNYAVNYAKHGVTLTSGTYAAKIQAAYILNNITGWRGEVAKQARAALKLETMDKPSTTA